MTYSLAPKLLLGLTLALTLLLKATVRDTANQSRELVLQDAVTASLARHQFQTHVAPDGIRMHGITATSGDCRLSIREMVPQGWNRDRLSIVSTQEDRLFFTFEGMVYTDPPVGIGSATMHHYWTRLKQKMGFNAISKPVLAVIASSNCSLDSLPLKEIADLS